MDSTRFVSFAERLVTELSKYQEQEREVVDLEIGWSDIHHTILIKAKAHIEGGFEYVVDNYICDSQNIEDADGATSTNSDEPNVFWTVTVMLHPVYKLPTAYVERMWNRNGNSFPITLCQAIFDQLRLKGCNNIYHAERTADGNHEVPVIDNRHYEFGRLTMELHPITDKTCFSFHVCQLPDIMSMLSSGSCVQIDPLIADSDSPAALDIQHALYLLNWLALMGPYFGVRISPALYSKLAAALV